MTGTSRSPLALLGALALLAAGAARAQAPAPTPPPGESARPAEQSVPAEPAKAEPPKAPTLTITAGDTSIKFGTLIQAQADWSQDAASGGYAQNLGIRRLRFNVAGNVTKKVFFFLQTENARLGFSSTNASGVTTKTIGSGLQMLDAVVEWRIDKAFNLWGGLIYIPTSRDALKSSATQLFLDQGSWAYTATGALGGSGGRDTGFLARGYFLDDRLEYRVGVFSGLRETGARNAYRMVGRVQYDVFDKEVYNFPAYAGSNLGTRKILAIGAAYDRQMDYDGITADVFADIPVEFGAVTGMLAFQRLDGGTTTNLPRSTILQVEGGAYHRATKLGPWLRYEQRRFSASGNKEKRWLAGLNYHLKGHKASLKAAYGRVQVTNAPRGVNQFVLQLQGSL